MTFISYFYFEKAILTILWYDYDKHRTFTIVGLISKYVFPAYPSKLAKTLQSVSELYAGEHPRVKHSENEAWNIAQGQSGEYRKVRQSVTYHWQDDYEDWNEINEHKWYTEQKRYKYKHMRGGKLIEILASEDKEESASRDLPAAHQYACESNNTFLGKVKLNIVSKCLSHKTPGER